MAECMRQGWGDALDTEGEENRKERENASACRRRVASYLLRQSVTLHCIVHITSASTGALDFGQNLHELSFLGPFPAIM